MSSPLRRDYAVGRLYGCGVGVKATGHDVRAVAVQARLASSRVEYVESGASLGMLNGGLGGGAWSDE